MKNGAAKKNDLLQRMIDVYVEDYPEAANNLEMLTGELGDNLVEIMFAGYNTAVPTMCHALWYIASNPDIERRVREEVDNVLGRERTPTYDDFIKLDLCNRIFKETLRLVPPAALISRQTTQDLVLDGADIPRATRVWMPACVVHRDPRWWGDDAGDFNPDRFLGKVKRGSFFPFSDGPRSCAGRNFAALEVVTGLAVLFQKYRFRIAADYDHKTIFTGFGLRPFDFNTARVCMRLTIHPRDD